jgi:type I restriction enzyme, S subunit
MRWAVSDLPDSWTQVTLIDVGEITTGNTPPTKQMENYGGDIPFVKPGDLDYPLPITKTEQTLSKKGAEFARLLRTGAVLVSCIGNLGKIGIAGVPLATNQQINSIEFMPSLVHDRYGYYYCKTLKPWMEREASATTVTILNKSRFSNAPFVLAPVNEQKRITEKLDILLARVDSCQSHLERVPQILKRFRQSVLAAATSGRLTEDWREKYVLQNEFRQIGFDDESIDIPSPWEESELYDVINPERPLCYGVVQPGEEAKGGIPLVRIQDLGNWKINTQDLRTVSPEIDAEYRRSRIKSGDLLLSVVGTIGRTAIVPSGFEANIARAIARISCREGVNPKWVNIWLSCDTLQWYLSKNSREVARKTLNLSELGIARIALPSSEEQAEIVWRVEKLFAYAERLEAHYYSAAEMVEWLTPSVLAKAFRGELVEQDADRMRRMSLRPCCWRGYRRRKWQS